MNVQFAGIYRVEGGARETFFGQLFPLPMCQISVVDFRLGTLAWTRGAFYFNMAVNLSSKVHKGAVQLVNPFQAVVSPFSRHAADAVVICGLQKLWMRIGEVLSDGGNVLPQRIDGKNIKINSQKIRSPYQQVSSLIFGPNWAFLFNRKGIRFR